MKRFATSLLLALAALTLSACSGYYQPREGTPPEEFCPNLQAAEPAKQERLK